MKTNKKHIIIPAFMMAVGLGLVGSISGTVAWYQYSTRVTGAYIGTSAKSGENLQIKAISMDGTKNSGYIQDVLAANVDTVLAGTTTQYGTALEPITTGELAKDAALPASLKKSPIYQYAATSTWDNATSANYVQFKLSFKATGVDSSLAYLAKNVYLTDVTIQNDASNSTIDLADAVRVHISAPGATPASGDPVAVNALFSKNGGATDVYGNLDLNNDGTMDESKGYADWETLSTLVYGDQDKQQVSYAATNGAVPATTAGSNGDIIANDTNPTLTGGTALCTTKDNGNDTEITVTIWLEGWQKLDTAPAGNAAGSSESAVWDANTYIGKKFNVGLRFAIQPYGVADY